MASFSLILGLFKQTFQFLQQINVKKFHPLSGTGIRTLDHVLLINTEKQGLKRSLLNKVIFLFTLGSLRQGQWPRISGTLYDRIPAAGTPLRVAIVRGQRRQSGIHSFIQSESKGK